MNFLPTTDQNEAQELESRLQTRRFIAAAILIISLEIIFATGTFIHQLQEKIDVAQSPFMQRF